MRAQGGGAIVNVSSGTVFSVLPLSGAYAASKQGLAMLSATARLELADAGIVVSTFYPFVTSTEFIGHLKAGKEAAAQMVSDGGLKAQPPELPADAIIDLIRSGAERADVVPNSSGAPTRTEVAPARCHRRPGRLTQGPRCSTDKSLVDRSKNHMQ